MALFLVQGAPNKAHLQEIETMALPVADSAAECLRETHRIEQLAEQKQTESFGPLEYVKYRVMKSVMSGVFHLASRTDEAYLYRRSAATARGTRILVALRQYQNLTGRWPESLNEIRSSLSREILTDPFNRGPFVYRRTPEAFKLYSRGQNNKDEDGRWDRTPAPTIGRSGRRTDAHRSRNRATTTAYRSDR